MRPILLTAALLSLVSYPPIASATTTDTFTIRGTDSDNLPYQVTFALDPANTSYGSAADGYEYTGVAGTLNQVADLFNIHEYAGADTYLDLDDEGNGDDGYGPDYAQQLVLLPNSSLQLFSSPSSSAPTVNPGTYFGYDDTNCDASLHVPSLGLGSTLSTLALLELPTIQTTCGSLVSVNATTPGIKPPPTPIAATPEPASLALFGTGALGLFSVARRRFAR